MEKGKSLYWTGRRVSRLCFTRAEVADAKARAERYNKERSSLREGVYFAILIRNPSVIFTNRQYENALKNKKRRFQMRWKKGDVDRIRF